MCAPAVVVSETMTGRRVGDTAKDEPTKESSPWPAVHPLVVLAVVPLLPTYFFMNRGFTQWFHWGFIAYLLTGRPDFLRRFQVIIGGAVCVGWYLAVAHEYLVHGRVCHLLYNNMPGAMKALMLENGHLASGGIITNNATALAAIGVSHIVDLVAHPYLTYVAWKLHTSRGGSLRNLVTWDVLASAYALRVLYATSHQYYNWGYVASPFYYGFEVYHIDNLDAYTAAYIGEGVWFAGLIVWKAYLGWMRRNNLRLNISIGGTNGSLQKKLSSSNTTTMNDDDLDRRKPALRMSSSCFSDDSTVTADDATTVASANPTPQ